MKKIYDIVIIGSGPAGISAAIYAARASLSVIIIEQAVYGGKLSKTYEIENYPGVERISGVELAQKFVDQVKNFNVEIVTGSVNKLEKNEYIHVYTSNGKVFKAKNVIVATGACLLYTSPSPRD